MNWWGKGCLNVKFNLGVKILFLKAIDNFYSNKCFTMFNLKVKFFTFFKDLFI